MNFLYFPKKGTPEFLSFVMSISLSVVFWIFAIIIFSLIPDDSKKYETIQITLSEFPESKPVFKDEQVKEIQKETPVINKTENLKEEILKNENQEIQNSTVEQNLKENSQTKTQSKSQNYETPSDKKVSDFVPKKSVEELMNERFESNSFLEDSWDESVFENESQSQNAKKIATESGISGISGSAAKNSNEKTLSSQKTNLSEQKNSISDSTSSAINDFLNAKSNSSLENSKSSENVLNSKNSSDVSNSVSQYDFRATDGSKFSRSPLGEFSLEFSSEAQKLLENIPLAQIKISFSVDSNGFVSDILIDSKAIIPKLVQSEIEDQIYMWLFTSGSGKVDAYFIWKIISQ